jgi:hypothetical protein
MYFVLLYITSILFPYFLLFSSILVQPWMGYLWMPPPAYWSTLFRESHLFQEQKVEKEEKSIWRADSEDVRDLRLPCEGEGGGGGIRTIPWTTASRMAVGFGHAEQRVIEAGRKSQQPQYRVLPAAALQMKGRWEKCLVPIYVFPEMKLIFPKQNYNVLSPSSYTQISVRGLYISRIGLPILLQENMWTDPGNI